MKKILVLGSGAREHAICEAIKRSKQENELYVVSKSKNPGIFKMAKEYLLGDPTDAKTVTEFAKKTGIDFAVVGPEAPIAKGIVDALLEVGIKSASPLKIAGQLESSKSFTRDLVSKYQIPGNPLFKTFFSEEGLSNFFDQLGENFVVKADGLKGGKGVKVSGDHLNGKAEGLAYAIECLKEGGKVVVEEKLIGQEFSLMSFCDGVHTLDMPPVQDHKRAYDGDKGPNTGGMGSYSCEDHLLPFLTAKDIEDASKINKLVAEALFKETGVYFKGVMYGGFMVTKNGVKLIEYNARFGDPEAMNVLPIMETDFVEICEAIINGTLDKVQAKFAKKATVCKYLVPNGYPENPVAGQKIVVGEIPAGVNVYYASVDEKEDGLYLSGSRAIAFVGIAENLEGAEQLAQSAIGAVTGPVFYRKDIGTKTLIDARVDMMKKLRD